MAELTRNHPKLLNVIDNLDKEAPERGMSIQASEWNIGRKMIEHPFRKHENIGGARQTRKADASRISRSPGWPHRFTVKFDGPCWDDEVNLAWKMILPLFLRVKKKSLRHDTQIYYFFWKLIGFSSLSAMHFVSILTRKKSLLKGYRIYSAYSYRGDLGQK